MNRIDEAKMDLVVPIHGNRPLNEIFFETLSKNTVTPFHLIVVDNASIDDSPEYFESLQKKGYPVTLIKNLSNQCYPVSINQGAALGKSPFVGLLNNDILVGPGWDVPLLKSIEEGLTTVASPAGLEHMPDPKLEKLLFFRWRFINKKTYEKDPRQNIDKKIKIMYRNFSRFAQLFQEKFSGQQLHGIMGHCHLLKRNLFESLNGLDVRIQAADWDLYLTIADKFQRGEVSSLPIIFGDSYVHHFIRATDSSRKKIPPICRHLPHISPEEKWSKERINELWPFKNQIPAAKKSPLDRLSRWFYKSRSFLLSGTEDPLKILDRGP